MDARQRHQEVDHSRDDGEGEVPLRVRHGKSELKALEIAG